MSHAVTHESPSSTALRRRGRRRQGARTRLGGRHGHVPDAPRQFFLALVLRLPLDAPARLATDSAALLAVLLTALAASATLLPVLRAALLASLALDFAALRLRVAAAFFAVALR